MKKMIVIIGAFLALLSAEVGDKAYKFTLPVINEGNKAQTMPMKGVVLVNMWASWCGGCKKEMPLLDTLAKKYKGKGLKIIAVNTDSKVQKAEKYCTKFSQKIGKQSDIIFVYDATKSVTKAYKARAFPMTLLIKNGKVLKEYVGSFDESNEAGLIEDITKAL